MTIKPPATKTATRNNPARTLPSSGRLQAFFVVDEGALRLQKLNEIATLLWVPQEATQKVKQERLVRAVELYESLAPVDGAEGMLAVQMVATHDAALQCLKRAAAPEKN